jgi:hypothetical protein
MYICISLLIGEFVGLMFDETVPPDVRTYFEDILSQFSVFMAQEGTPTVSDILSIFFIHLCFSSFSMANH